MTPAYSRTQTAGAAAHGAPLDAENMSRLSVWVFIAWLATYVVEGPLRAGLATVGLQNLLYGRDLLALTGVAWGVLMPLLHRRRPAPGLVLMVWLLAVHVCIGLLLGGTLFQRLFGVKIFIPLLYGVAVFPAVERHFPQFLRAMAAFFTVSVLGVFINAIIGDMPWAGLRYETAFGAAESTRQWWMTGGVSRLPGFARASFDAAMVIGLCGVMVIALSPSIWWRALVATLGMAAIFLTTSKGMVAGFGIAALWLVLADRSDTSFKLGCWIAAALLMLTCLLPTVFMIVRVPEASTEVPELMLSLWDRFAWMWPSAYDLLPDGFGALTGVGPGGIGTALDQPDQKFVPNSGDSIFVYFFVTFGVAGVGYLGFALLAIVGRGDARDARAFVWAGLLIIAYGYGLSINMVEQSFFCAVFGLIYGRAFAAVSATGERA